MLARFVGGVLQFDHNRRSHSGSPCALRIEDRLRRDCVAWVTRTPRPASGAAKWCEGLRVIMSGSSGSVGSPSQTGLRSFAQSVRLSAAVSKLFHRRMLWIWPVVAAGLLVVVGWFIRNVVEQAMKEMNGAGVWRAPKSVGVGANPYEALLTEKDEPLTRWQKKTLRVLKQHLQPDPRSRNRTDELRHYHIPVLSPGDRRAFFRSMWSPFLPDATWDTTVSKREGTAQVYLDVSGSMSSHDKLPLLKSAMEILVQQLHADDPVASVASARAAGRAARRAGPRGTSPLRHPRFPARGRAPDRGRSSESSPHRLGPAPHGRQWRVEVEQWCHLHRAGSGSVGRHHPPTSRGSPLWPV